MRDTMNNTSSTRLFSRLYLLAVVFCTATQQCFCYLIFHVFILPETYLLAVQPVYSSELFMIDSGWHGRQDMIQPYEPFPPYLSVSKQPGRPPE